MKEKFENTNETNSSGTREAISIMCLIVSVVLMLALVTRETILSDFGAVLANLSLGIFGFSSYAIYSFAIILSIVTLFTKKTKNNGLIVFSVALMIFSVLIALQVWTASAENIEVNSITFGEFISESYNLECIGLYGSSAGGAFFSAIIYYPVALLKVVGTYVISGLIFVVAIFGLIVGVRKKMGYTNYERPQRQRYNTRTQQLPNDFANSNPVKMGFAPNINELRNNQMSADTNFQGRNFYDNLNQANGSQQLQEQQQQAPALSAHELLYPNRANEQAYAQNNTQNYAQNNAQNSPQNYVQNNPQNYVQNNVPPQQQANNGDNFEEYDNMKGLKRNSKLFVSNVGKSVNLNQKTKREMHVEEKEKKRAQDILFNVSDDGTDFTIDNSNRPKNLANDRKSFDKRVDTIRDDSTYFGTFNSNLVNEKKSNFPSYEDTHKNVDFINKPAIRPNEDIKYDFNASGDEQTQRRKDLFSDKTNAEQNKENDVDLSEFTQPKMPQKEVKKDEVAEMFRIVKPKQPQTIISASNYVKKEDLEAKENAETIEAQNKADEQAKIDEEKKNASKFYTQEDYANNTKELKDLFASGKIKDRTIEIPDSNLGFDKIMPVNAAKIKILKSVNEISPEKAQRQEKLDTLSKAILNAPVDDAFNQIEFKDESFDELMRAEGVVDDRQKVPQVYSLDDFEKNKAKAEVEQPKTHSVFYPLNPVKEIKVPNGEVATQLPIIAKETHTVVENKPIERTPYNFPPIELLKKGNSDVRAISEETEQKSRILENILKSFSINSKVVETVIGPVITRYELEIQQGIQVKRVEQISKDITMGLESPCEVIIQAPIPGKNRLGIEVPNKTKEMVRLRDVLDTEAFRTAKSTASYALGKEVDGKSVICDITRMPHLLIAGSTGTGKSVCLNTILVSILYHATPEDVRLILIDPKRVEFTAYRNLPHLLIDEIICDSEKAISALAWAIDEMESRFMLFQSTMTKDIDTYNAKLDLTVTKKLPRIVIIVDELADLLTMNKKELEEKISRLAQKSRAAGIHLILATQRPSVDVITGVIKTNLPSRISFKLSNGIDSKTVLDETGSEKLLGNGDMFYKPVFENTKVRVQGCYISGKEVEEVVDFVKNNNKAEFDESIKSSIIYTKKEDPMKNLDEEETQLDDKFVEALKLAIENSQISISMIQRRYSVGYNRAGKILDTMEKMGYVSSFNGSKPREVYITKEQFEKDFGEF